MDPFSAAFFNMLSQFDPGLKIVALMKRADSGDKNAQTMLGEAAKGAVAEVARSGAEASTSVGDAAIVTAAATSAVGLYPLAQTAGTVATGADIAGLAFNATADLIEGNGYSETAKSGASVLVDLAGIAFAPSFNLQSTRFHSHLPSSAGKFVKNNAGAAGQGGVPIAAKIAGLVTGLFVGKEK